MKKRISSMKLTQKVACLVVLVLLTNFLLVYYQTAHHTITVVHIPKTAGSSLNSMLDAHYQWNPFVTIQVLEKCFEALYDPTQMNLVTFRNPRAHVYSQYMMCRYDSWGIAKTDALFPRSKDDVTDLKEWLAFFTKSTYRAKDGDFDCYNPYNLQARYMTCESTFYNGGHHAFTSVDLAQPQKKLDKGIVNVKFHDSLLTPNINDAKKNVDRIDWVGIVELFPESICVLMYKLDGKLPASCACDSGILASVQEDHIRHDVPVYDGVETLPNDIINMIDQVTEVDKQLYAYALKRCLEDIRTLESQLNVQILCRPIDDITVGSVK